MTEITTTRVHLVDWRTGEVCYPVKYVRGKNKGCFGLALRKGSKGGSNKAEDHAFVKTEEEMIELIRQGHEVRIKVNGKPNLRRYNLFVDGKQVTFKNRKSA